MKPLLFEVLQHLVSRVGDLAQMHDAVRVSQLGVSLEVPDDQVVHLPPLGDPIGIQFFDVDCGEFSHEFGGRAALAATL